MKFVAKLKLDLPLPNMSIKQICQQLIEVQWLVQQHQLNTFIKFLPRQPLKNKNMVIGEVSIEHLDGWLEQRPDVGSLINSHVLPTVNMQKAAATGKVFGQSIEKVMAHQKTLYADFEIPAFVAISCDKILKEGLKTEGIFRLAPSLKALNDLQEKIDKTGKIDYENKDELFPSSLLKRFFRDMEPRIINENAPFDVVGMNTPEQVQHLKNALKKLNPVYRKTLQKLLHLLSEISKSKSSTKMDAQNLSIMFAPNLFPVEMINTLKSSTLEKAKNVNKGYAIETMIVNYDLIFSPNEVWDDQNEQRQQQLHNRNNKQLLNLNHKQQHNLKHNKQLYNHNKQLPSLNKQQQHLINRHIHQQHIDLRIREIQAHLFCHQIQEFGKKQKQNKAEFIIIIL